ALERLERLDAKVSRAVLRGLGHGNVPRLPGEGGGNIAFLSDRWSRASNGTSPAAYFINEVLIKTACHLGPKQATIEQSQAKMGDTSRQNDINQKSPSRSRSHPSQLLANSEK